MKTPGDFDYDIWKDENGLYFVRVKRTGEITQVSEEVVRELWLELYRMSRYCLNTTFIDADGCKRSRIVSLDEARDSDTDDSDSCFVGSENPYDAVENEMMESTFLKVLTPKQRRIYELRFKMRLSISECANRLGVSSRNVDKLIRLIRNKAKRFF